MTVNSIMVSYGLVCESNCGVDALIAILYLVVGFGYYNLGRNLNRSKSIISMVNKTR